ncbi:exocyst complex component Sec6 [Heliocybe sulcata]|uniref:Exocyst complex component Sec6 n=1 Tax=Heliocybe sulcata TaxID=5364 RepID=A0A5C3N228_9AGAM|nr:exocyst complex component Sec6 [Heliocybe sulcata]
MTSVQAINAPTLSAAQAVGEYLQSPDDLLKIVAFRKKLEKEKASIDARLKSGVKEQLDATKDGLRKLFGTRNNVQAVKDEIVTVDRLCSDPKNNVPTFGQISRVSMVHRNFEQVEEMVNNLLEMNSKLDMLEDMLARNREEVVGPAPNLLAIHYNINQLEAFRSQTMHQAKKASASSRNTLTRWFERLTNLVKSFDEYILDLARNILPLIRAGYSEVVVKLVKIAEIEGKEDEKAIAIRLVRRAAKMDAAAKFRSMQADARVFKHYRSNITKTITESIRHKFEEGYQEYENDAGGFLDSLTWMYQDLIRIEEEVVPCFPPEWEIYSLYVREYHKTLNATLQKLLSSEPEASVLLVLHSWLKEYKKNMKELNVPAELMEPPLLDGKEQGLIEDYVNLIIKKLDEWTNNLMTTEIQTFTTRSEPLEEDSDGQYAMQGAVILFQMVNQQVDVAMESGQGAILARVISEVNRVMRMIQEQWTKTVEGEFKKHVEKAEESAEGLVEYDIALANDQIKSADFTEALSARLEPLVSEKYRVQISECLNDAIDGFLDVAKKCIQTLIDIIFNDLKPVTKQLFQQAWYDGSVIEQIVATMRDYMADCQVFLNPTLLELLIEDLLDNFLVTYITALVNSPSKLKMPAAADRIKDDVSSVFKFFSTLKQPKELEEMFEVIELILGMLEASQSMVFLSFWSFAKVHGPNLQFVESLIRMRGDFDRSAVSEVMDSIKRKAKDENLSDPPEPTIMKKISIQSTFSRLVQRVT